MEVLYAFCCSEFQAVRGSQQQNTATIESIQTELANILQQLWHLDQRTNAIESRPTGARPESSGAAPSPAGSPPTSGGQAASGAAWRNGTWRGSEPSGAAAGPGPRYALNAGAPTPAAPA
eukprot:8622156-Alexandrium_andersonii.AAC.2